MAGEADRRSCASGSASPRATRSCHSTRSSPVIASVTGCSTCSRVFISMKQKRPSAVEQELDRAGAFVVDRRAARRARWRPGARAAPGRPPATALPRSASGADAAPSSRARRGAARGRGDRRRPGPRRGARRRARARGSRRRRRTPPGASARARAARRRSPAPPRRSRMPRPPPPALALIISGKPMRVGFLRERARHSGRRRRSPGCTARRPRASAASPPPCRPSRAIASGDGPMKTRPASRQACANAAFSARKP